MKIVRHDAYIAKRKRRAILMAALGFILLTGTLFLALNPNLIAISYTFMAIGFIVFNLGMQQVGRWSRNPRNDQVLDYQLRSLPDKFTIVHYADAGGKRLDHVLVHPGGALVITAKEIEGRIQQNGVRWRKTGLGLRRLLAFSGPQLGSPSIETERAETTLESFLAAKQLEVDVEGAIVFIHPNVELDIEEPDYPVLHADELSTYVQSLPADDALTTRERDVLVSTLRGEELPVEAASVKRRRPVRRRAG